MDFFASQDAARKKTSLLVVYFLLAVALIVASVYLAVSAIFVWSKGGEPSQGAVGLWNPGLLALVAACTLTVIGLGSLYRTATLSAGGGDAVARMLGGRPVSPNTTDLEERVLLNVVEEMAIAAGTPVPPVYLLDGEQAINAFAAGFTPQTAVIGVTRGAVQTLTRDELQGVIAHEFSHILNGDMRLNLRLIGVLYGILLIALVGYGLLRTTAGSSGSSSGNKKGGNPLPLLGLALYIIGYVGVFFGHLIKSAVSRQREFLADASAVQFTRNPPGIGGALRKIGGLAAGARLKSSKAEEASHMFFGNALKASFLGLMSTHPPLDERIRRIDPQFDGTFPKVVHVKHTEAELRSRALPSRPKPQTAAAAGAMLAFQPAAAVASVGAPQAEHVAYAAALVASLPERLAREVHDPPGAVATVYALLLNDDPQARQIQLDCLRQQGEAGFGRETGRLAPLVKQLGAAGRLPLVELALPSLRQLSTAQYGSFRDTVHQLMDADQKISLFEYALGRMLTRHLAPSFERVPQASVKYQSLRPLLPACGELLSALAGVGSRDTQEVERAFAAGLAGLGIAQGDLPLQPPEQRTLSAVDRALRMAREASGAVKKQVLAACAECIGADGQVTVEEAELLRAIADALDCPMPPLLANAVAG